MCTLRELQEVYSFSDVLDMAEVITVNNVNEALAYEYAQKER